MCKQNKDNELKKKKWKFLGSFFQTKSTELFSFLRGDQRLDEAVLAGDLPIRILLLALLGLPLLQTDDHVRLHRPQAHQRRCRPETHQRLKKNQKTVVTIWLTTILHKFLKYHFQLNTNKFLIFNFFFNLKLFESS